MELVTPAPTTSTTWPPRAATLAATSKRTPSEKSRKTSSQPPDIPILGSHAFFPPHGSARPRCPFWPCVPAGLRGRGPNRPRYPGCLPSRGNCRDPCAQRGYPISPGQCRSSFPHRAHAGDELHHSPDPVSCHPLSASLARVSLQVTPVIPTVPATPIPASAGPQAGGLVCATLTAPQVTLYASSASHPPPADSPQSSLNPFPAETAPPPRSGTVAFPPGLMRNLVPRAIPVTSAGRRIASSRG
ncbi:MAG: hypothetical protein FD187_3242, partial [bacterium]